ncbi:hypothetical protein [Deinococcus roseus]|nr:hypothetical protein [Deinococcus roseus]
MESMVLNKSRKEVSDPEVAAFLTEAASVRYFEPFLGQECTLKDAASQLKISMSGLFYWLQRMLDLQILEVSRIQERRGRAIKHYRSVADGFFIPFHLTRAGTHEDMLRDREKPQQDLLIRSMARVREKQPQKWGILLSREEPGLIRSMFASADGPAKAGAQSPASMSGWITAHLSPAQASMLQQRMQDLLQEVTLMGEAGEGEHYVLHVGMAPTGQDHS